LIFLLVELLLFLLLDLFLVFLTAFFSHRGSPCIVVLQGQVSGGSHTPPQLDPLYPDLIAAYQCTECVKLDQAQIDSTSF
jgi:hypothetical protein